MLLSELGPQPAHVHVYGSGPPVVVIPPYLIKQGFPGEDLARSSRQEAKQLVLHLGKVQGPSIYRSLISIQVQKKRPLLDYRVALTGARLLEPEADPCHQL